MYFFWKPPPSPCESTGTGPDSGAGIGIKRICLFDGFFTASDDHNVHICFIHTIMSYIKQADNSLQVDNFTANSHIIQSLFATKKCFCLYTYHFLFPIRKLKHQARTKDSHKANLYVLKVAIILALQKKRHIYS